MRTCRYSPPVTRCWGGATGAGVPRPSTTNRAKAWISVDQYSGSPGDEDGARHTHRYATGQGSTHSPARQFPRNHPGDHAWSQNEERRGTHGCRPPSHGLTPTRVGFLLSRGACGAASWPSCPAPQSHDANPMPFSQRVGCERLACAWETSLPPTAGRPAASDPRGTDGHASHPTVEQLSS